MRRLRFVTVLTVLGVLAGPGAGLAQEQELTPEAVAQLPAVGEEEYIRGRVERVISEVATPVGGAQQELAVVLLSGAKTGATVQAQFIAPRPGQHLTGGDRVVLMAVDGVEGRRYWIVDHYRLPALVGLLAGFFVLTVGFAGWRGLSSLVGMAVSIAILATFVVPHIMAGKNPMLISLVGAFLIATISIYLAHGFRRRTSVALVSTLITIGLATGLAVLSVSLAKLFGLGSEEAFYLQAAAAQGEVFNLQGLLLGGIIIGALGVLDDITTAQAAAVDEIRRANPRLTPRELIQRGFSVGREHITSLVNTLVLAYAGASLPLLLLFTVYQRPLWVILNSEQIAEEVIRTLVGSTALILAVPITTWLAAHVLSRGASDEQGPAPHIH